MNNDVTIKLLPTGPITTGQLLSIYCVKDAKIPLYYRAFWKRINQVRSTVQQISNHQGSSYRSTPADLGCLIEVTIAYEINGKHYTKNLIVQVNAISRKLCQRQLQPTKQILGKINDQINVSMYVHKANLQILNNYNNELLLPLRNLRVKPGTLCNQLSLVIENKKHHLAQQYCSMFQKNSTTFPLVLKIIFFDQIDRDFILLKYLQYERVRDPSGFKSKINAQFNYSLHNIHQQQSSLSQKSHSNDKIQKISISKKRIQNNQISKKYLKNRIKSFKQIQKKSILIQNKKQQNRECLNIFQEDELQADLKQLITNDNPSINLRSSFEQLEKSFHDKSSINVNWEEKNQLKKLKQENLDLKKQINEFRMIKSQRDYYKKKYEKTLEKMNRLQLQQKQIITERQRFQTLMLKKQYLKKQIPQWKKSYKNENTEILKNNYPGKKNSNINIKEEQSQKNHHYEDNY